jgi:DNA processing protein
MSNLSTVVVPAPIPLLTNLPTRLALALTQGRGATRIKKPIKHYGTGERVFQASLTELEATARRAVSAQSRLRESSLELAQQECAKAAEAGAKIISLSDPEYPPPLKEICDPPVILFEKGNVEVLAQPGIAMVGTQHPTPYGSGMAERLSTELAARGLVIISGMAPAASIPRRIAAPSLPREKTVAVKQIVALGGALISEFPVGTFPAPQDFPIRNRIISGMSAGVLVVEAAEHSGTRIPLCPRTKPRRLRRSGQRNQQEFLGPEYPDQAGSEALCHVGRRVGRASGGCTVRARFHAE